MLILDRIQKDLDILLADIGVHNSIMETIGKSKDFKHMVVDFERNIKKQINEVVNDGLFEVIHSRISKAVEANVIFTESDELEIQDAVAEEMRKHPFSNFMSELLVLGYLISVFEKGGQNFLNKHNLPKTFKLTNEGVKQIIAQRPPALFKGMDESTSRWISDQIVVGKKVGVPTKDIIEGIQTKLPQYPAYRAETIVRTESSNMLGQSEQTTAFKNGASHKDWLTAKDSRVSKEICERNESQGMIGINSAFASGVMTVPGHPNCRCVNRFQFTPFMGSIWAGQ